MCNSYIPNVVPNMKKFHYLQPDSLPRFSRCLLPIPHSLPNSSVPHSPHVRNEIDPNTHRDIVAETKTHRKHGADDGRSELEFFCRSIVIPGKCNKTARGDDRVMRLTGYDYSFSEVFVGFWYFHRYISFRRIIRKCALNL